MTATLMVPLFSLEAQVLTPADYPGQAHLSNQEYLVVHAGGQEYLAVEARYSFEPPRQRGGYAYTYNQPAMDIAPPARLAWVIPVPAGAQLLDPPSTDLFGEMYDFTHPSDDKLRYRLRTGRPQGLNRFGENLLSGGLEVGEGGALSWKVIEGSGGEALAALQAWAQQEGFAGPNPQLAGDYASMGWTFAVGVLESPESSGLLGPGAVAFPSTDLVLPLRFQAEAGEFDLALYAFSDKIFDKRPLSNWRLSGVNAWENRHRQAWFEGYIPIGQTAPPESLKTFLSGLSGQAPLPPFNPPDLNFYVFEGEKLNGYGRTTANQRQEFALYEKGQQPQPISYQRVQQQEEPRGLRDPQQRMLRQMRRRSY
jgi:hypothetical protein